MLGLALLALMGSARESLAQEARCTQLNAQSGAGTCRCSSKLDSQTWTNVGGGGAQWRPVSNVSSNECSMEATNFPVARNSPVSGTNSADGLLTKLPSGHTVGFPLWAGQGNTGIFWIGNDAASSDCASGFERCAFRWYTYKSTNFENTNSGFGGACSGDKDAEVKYDSGPDSVINVAEQVTGDNMAMYNFSNNGWTPNVDCCGQGPRFSSDTVLSGSLQKGRWFRFEVVVYNPSGGTGTSRLGLEMYAKNVTDNTAEVKILDIRGDEGSPNWSGPYNTITPPGRVRTVKTNAYREGTCAGFESYLYYMAAHWATNSGQRIGAATEIESGGGGPTPPLAPSNLRIQP